MLRFMYLEDILKSKTTPQKTAPLNSHTVEQKSVAKMITSVWKQLLSILFVEAVRTEFMGLEGLRTGNTRLTLVAP